MSELPTASCLGRPRDRVWWRGRIGLTGALLHHTTPDPRLFVSMGFSETIEELPAHLGGFHPSFQPSPCLAIDAAGLVRGIDLTLLNVRVTSEASIILALSLRETQN